MKYKSSLFFFFLFFSFFFFFFFPLLSENNIAFNGAADGICYSRGEVQKRYRVATPTLKRSLSTRTASVFNAFASSAGRSLNTKPIPDRPPCSFVSLNNIFSRTLAIVSTFLLFLFFFSLSKRHQQSIYLLRTAILSTEY